MNFFAFFVTMISKSMIPFLLCAVLLFSCQKSADFFIREPSRIMLIDQADGELAQIAEDARDTLPGFFWHLARARAGEKQFYIKYPFPADDETGVSATGGVVTEQIWLTGIHFKNNRYYGQLTSVPMHLSGMKPGDTVIFEADDITDWMFVRSGRIIGGLSVKYLLEKIPEDQRSDGEQNLLRMFD